MRKANKAARTAFTSRRYRELMQNNRFECYKHLDPQPQSDVAICPHHHAFYEIIFVVQGDLFYEVEGRPYHLKRGDVILIDELQFHHGLIHHQQNYERYALWIHPKYMQMLSRRFPKLDPQYCFLQLNSDNNNVVHLDQHSFEELEHLTLGGLRRAVVDGDVKTGSVMAGQIAGMVKEKMSCHDLIQKLVKETDDLIGGKGFYE